jgi:hypothetical protein
VRKRAGRQAPARSQPDEGKRSIGCFVPFVVRIGGSQPARQAGMARLRGETTIFERAKVGEQIRMLKGAGHAVARDAIGGPMRRQALRPASKAGPRRSTRSIAASIRYLH